MSLVADEIINVENTKKMAKYLLKVTAKFSENTGISNFCGFWSWSMSIPGAGFENPQPIIEGWQTWTAQEKSPCHRIILS